MLNDADFALAIEKTVAGAGANGRRDDEPYYGGWIRRTWRFGSPARRRRFPWLAALCKHSDEIISDKAVAARRFVRLREAAEHLGILWRPDASFPFGLCTPLPMRARDRR